MEGQGRSFADGTVREIVGGLDLEEEGEEVEEVEEVKVEGVEVEGVEVEEQKGQTVKEEGVVGVWL